MREFGREIRKDEARKIAEDHGYDWNDIEVAIAKVERTHERERTPVYQTIRGQVERPIWFEIDDENGWIRFVLRSASYASYREFADDVESIRYESKLRHESTTVDGVTRWNASGNVVPFDVLESAGREVTREQRLAREREIDEAIASYKAARATMSEEAKAEERYEMLAAFGPGETVVDVITGERFEL